MFEWWKVVPADSVEQLKAFLYPACITHADNPLVNGGPGLELALGTLKSNGECRMMFTSKQIEYIRYWLYEMELTPQRIPLPSSEFLVSRIQSSQAATAKAAVITRSLRIRWYPSQLPYTKTKSRSRKDKRI